MRLFNSKSFLSTILIILIVSMVLPPSFIDPLTGSAETEDGSSSSFELVTSKAKKIARLTGATPEGETIPNPNNTVENYRITGTDLGIMWDKSDGEYFVLFGDTNGIGPNEWRSNTLAISSDNDVTDGITFDTMIQGEQGFAKEILQSKKINNDEITVIPTAGITVGDRHYIHYMSVNHWGKAGTWFTNYSGLAYSDDDGENWTKTDVRWSGDSNFAQAAMVKEDGYVYMYGTPSGRFGSLYLARVPEKDLLVKASYEYWNGEYWVKEESAATEIIEQPVSEISVAYNSYYDKWIMMYLNEDRYSIVMRTSSNLTHGWSGEVVVAKGSEFPQLYGPFIHPWTNDGKDLYFVMSEFGNYNVFLMHTTLEKGTTDHNLVKDSSFEKQTSGTISSPWRLAEGNGGIDRGINLSWTGINNAWLRSSTGYNELQQTVEVEKNTDYEFFAFTRTAPSNKNGVLGVRDGENNIISEASFGHHDEYRKVRVKFNSGDNSEVTIFAGMEVNSDTWVQFDSFYLLPVDTVPPVLTLNGDEVINVPFKSDFTDPGATAFDEVDGDLTHRIVVEGEVDTNVVGTYTLTYNVKDAEGNAAQSMTRTVHVVGDEYVLENVSVHDGEGNEIEKLPKKGFVTASADVTNNIGEAKSVTLVVALYNKKGEIENLSGVTKAVSTGMTETFTGGFKMPGNNSGYELKVFVAESLTNLEPISVVKSISQK